MQSLSDPRRAAALVRIKLLHSAVWSAFVACIAAIPIAGLLHRFGWAFACSTAVLLECCILALNRFRCSLTNLAGRYTDDRHDNFDIYLPLWLVRYNKLLRNPLRRIRGLRDGSPRRAKPCQALT